MDAGPGEPRIIVVCLGNPGERYARTRHNAGWLFADWFHERHGLSEFTAVEGCPAEGSDCEAAGAAVLLIKPTVAMNDAGSIIAPLRERSREGDLWVVVHDDLDLPVGACKGRQKGSHGGHNGVRSLLEAAGDLPFFRLKLGVQSDRKRDFASVADFLLADMDDEERALLAGAFPRTEEILLGYVKSARAAQAKRDRHVDATRQFTAELLDEARRAVADLPNVSPRPILLPRREVRRLFDITTALAKLVRKARRCFAIDDDCYESLMRSIPNLLRHLLPPRSAEGRLVFAVDFHLSDGRAKVIELNCAVGMAHYARLADEALLPLLQGRLGKVERPNEVQFADFLYLHGLRPMHDPKSGVIAFLRGFNNEDMFNAEEVARLALRIEERHGVDVALVHERDLLLEPDGLHLMDGDRVDVLYVEENLSDWGDLPPDSLLVKAVRSGDVKTFPRLDMFLYTNKGFLAALANPLARPWFDPDEEQSKVIRGNILWSHPLDEHIEPAVYHMLAEGLTLVLKGALGGGGREVDILRPGAASQQTGQILRRRMVEGGTLVQGYFPPGRWGPGSDLCFDVRVLVAADEADIHIGPVYGRVFRGEKANFSDADSGVAPVYVLD